MQPMDGTVRGTVALASPEELREAVEDAKAAQPAWAATNPQRRVRVLMKFLDLVQREYDELADLLAREHGKTIADAKGDIQRGLEVVEVCIGAPHMMKGEFTDGAGPGIDVYLDAPAARRRRRHHAVQFSGDDPAVEGRAGDRLRQRLHPEAVGARSGRADPARRTVRRGRAAGRHPQRRQRRQGGGRRHSRRSATSRRSASSARPRSRITSIRAAARRASACSASAAPRTT